MEPVVTKRLIIRRMAQTDLLDFLTYQTHPEVLRYTPIEPLTEERGMGFLTRQAVVEIGDEGGYIAFAIQHIGDAKMIGEVSMNLLPKAQSKGEIGWSLHPSYQGHGYATEAAQVLLTYGFAHRKLHRITSICDTRNTASFRLMERLGMRREGHLRQSQFIKGEWQDEYIYALLHDEWLARQSVIADGYNLRQ
ncbi:MAG: GNAT family N-acetyltransferase [Brasilonema octagenarum HA4186-MV1]|uniref:GNAT family N-acetyltransferase n=2 Tax=Brasilonema TaxID=383614 RepID=A0A856MDD7_9CYAN|nr:MULTISPECIES: GNAT family protein [Brasilonema]MBW4628387.1 GNAT family N-acetyltransferase [Brasilonema octagenarum HA4186-MV1]NMF65557.1 GNAT family N-acetyltransferase [Brasilonema octagenarum UFV-OR1]QDL07047.1 GNAT family N-acetyltransferase [Brasilonema sennae CENA114]QDL13409.1 GNAT family N-acetyltransferase [Brasilonema octagenarum UFV-E1]